MRKTMLKACVVAVAMVTIPTLGSAKQTVALGGVAEAERSVDPVALENQAKSLFDSPTHYGEAAKLYLQAADERDPGDPQRVTNLEMASRLLFYTGKISRSAQVMERAAEEAHAAGDVLKAAHLYIDASFLWNETTGNGETVIELVKKAQLLTASPLIARTDRAAILSRIET